MLGDRHRVILQRAQSRRVPIEVMLELTHRCNLRCVHCYIPSHHRSDGVTTERWLRLLDELVDAGTLFLDLSGGEPLLHPDWLLIARRARSLGFCTVLLTNATLVDERSADQVAELSIPADVSFYSTDPSTYERVTGVPGSFARAERGVRLLVERGVEVRLKAPAMTATLAGVEAVERYAQSIGAAFGSDSRLVCRADGDPGPTLLRVAPGDLLDLHRAAVRGDIDVEGAVMPDPGRAVCGAGARIATVTAGGDLLACPRLREAAGNLNRSSFRDLWTGSEWLLRLASLRVRDLPVCRDCSRLAYCQRCPAVALVEDGDLLGPSRWSCEFAAALERAGAGAP